jgi:hypothetical protein
VDQLTGLLVEVAVVHILVALQVVLVDLVEDLVVLMLEQVQVEQMQIIPVLMHSKTLVVVEVQEHVPLQVFMVEQVVPVSSSSHILPK